MKKNNVVSLTDFQLKVLQATLKIPLGEVRSYSWIARQIGSPKAVRAVGSALAKNPYPLIIPCHRVVKSSAQNRGDLGEYSGGEEIKAQLIQLEKRLKNIFCLNRKKEVSLYKKKPETSFWFLPNEVRIYDY